MPCKVQMLKPCNHILKAGVLQRLDESLDETGLIKITQRSDDGSRARAIIGGHEFEVSLEETEINQQGTVGIALHLGSPPQDLTPADVGGV